MKKIIIFCIALVALYGGNELFAQGTCATAIEYTVQECNSYFLDVTLTTTDDSGGVDVNCPDDGANEAYWFKVTVPAGNSGLDVNFDNITNGSGAGNFKMSIYSGACGALTTEVSCESVNVVGSEFFYPLAPGDYFVRLINATSSNTEFDIAFNDYLGDNPANPIPLETASGLYCNFSAQGDGCANGVSGNCLFTEDNSIYYSFTVDASTTQPVEFGLENIVCAGDMQIQVINLDCTRVVDNNGTTLNAVCDILTGAASPQYTADLPNGDYLLIVDGDSGDLCSWGLSSTIIVECPDFTGITPADIVIDSESTCTTFGGAPTGGAYSAPAVTNCPTGSTLEYAVDGGTFSATLPTYNDATSETITTRCNCDTDTSMSSSVSAGVTTMVGVCPTCTDGVMNGGETGIDCGGPDCGACAAACAASSGTFEGQ